MLTGTIEVALRKSILEAVYPDTIGQLLQL